MRFLFSFLVVAVASAWLVFGSGSKFFAAAAAAQPTSFAPGSEFRAPKPGKVRPGFSGSARNFARRSGNAPQLGFIVK